VKVPQGLKAAFLLTETGRLEAFPFETIYRRQLWASHPGRKPAAVIAWGRTEKQHLSAAVLNK
jgi:hypothetical protein